MLLIRNTLHSYSGCLKTYGFILFLSIFIYVLSRWSCDHPLNSVPGNGTGFPYTEKPRNQRYGKMRYWPRKYPCGYFEGYKVITRVISEPVLSIIFVDSQQISEANHHMGHCNIRFLFHISHRSIFPFIEWFHITIRVADFCSDIRLGFNSPFLAFSSLGADWLLFDCCSSSFILL